MSRNDRESNGSHKHRHVKQGEAGSGKPGLTDCSDSWFQLQASLRGGPERIHSCHRNNNGRRYYAHGSGQEHPLEIEQTDHECAQGGSNRPRNRPSRAHRGGAPLGRFGANSIKMPLRQGKELRKPGEAGAEGQTSDQKE